MGGVGGAASSPGPAWPSCPACPRGRPGCPGSGPGPAPRSELGSWHVALRPLALGSASDVEVGGRVGVVEWNVKGLELQLPL